MTTTTNTELRDIVLESYMDSGDRAGAVSALVDRWYNDRRFRKLAEYEVVRQGIGTIVSHLMHQIKDAAVRPESENGNRDDESIIEILRQRGLNGMANAGRSHVARTAAAIFLYPLYGGKPIGTAYRPEILESAENHKQQAGGHIRAARREELVAKALPNDETRPVDFLSAEEMLALFERADE